MADIRFEYLPDGVKVHLDSESMRVIRLLNDKGYDVAKELGYDYKMFKHVIMHQTYLTIKFVDYAKMLHEALQYAIYRGSKPTPISHVVRNKVPSVTFFLNKDQMFELLMVMRDRGDCSLDYTLELAPLEIIYEYEYDIDQEKDVYSIKYILDAGEESLTGTVKRLIEEGHNEDIPF